MNLLDVDAGVMAIDRPVAVYDVLLVLIVEFEEVPITCKTIPVVKPVTVAPVTSMVPFTSSVAPLAISISPPDATFISPPEATVIAEPEGRVNVSEASPRVTSVPVAGDILFCFNFRCHTILL